jgi:putative ABC transport system substrate-binding protein
LRLRPILLISHSQPGRKVLASRDCTRRGPDGGHMRRREFIKLMGAATVLWPVAGRAQRPAKLATIGYMGPNTPLVDRYRLPAFVKRLNELGWIEGRTVVIDYRWAEGRSEHLAEIAAEFVKRKIDVIVTGGTPATAAAKQATSTIPIVFAAVGDPVGTGIVESLARPGGNVTGLSLQQTESADKRLELLREVIPGLRHLAVIANGGNPSAVLEMREAEATARTIGIEVVSSEIRRLEDFVSAFEGFKNRVDALYVCSDQSGSHQHFRVRRQTSYDVWRTGVHRSRRIDFL